MNDIDLSGEYKALKQALKDIKELHLTLVLKFKDMTETIRPNLEALYMTKIGVKELEFLHVQAEVAGLKHTMELMIACLNKNQVIDRDKIEDLVRHELEKYYNRINQMAEKINQARQHLSSLMNHEDSTLLKSLYYDLARRFHPDVNSALTDEQKKLWNIINDAYSIGDLTTIKNIHLATSGKEAFSDLLLDFDTDKRQLELLKEKNTLIMNKIDRLDEEFPFTLKDKLTDEQWITTEQEAIAGRLQTLQQEAEKYNEYINLIMGN